jgi:hypothetical protein
VYIVVAQVVAIVRPLVPIMFVWSPERWPGSVLPRCVLRGAVAGVRSCSALLSSGALTRAIAFGNSRFVFAGTCTCKAFVPGKKKTCAEMVDSQEWVVDSDASHHVIDDPRCLA